VGALVTVAGAVVAALRGLDPAPGERWGAVLGVGVPVAMHWARAGVAPCGQPTAWGLRAAHGVYGLGAAVGLRVGGAWWSGLVFAGAALQVAAGRSTSGGPPNRRLQADGPLGLAVPPGPQ
jgi:hypothetical protein